MRLLIAAIAALVLVTAPMAFASETHPSSLEVQRELWCDDCQTTLDEASAVSYTPALIGLINSEIAAGKTKSEIKQEAITKYRGHVSLLSSKSVHPKASLTDLEGEVMCPVCHTTLDQSSSPLSRRIKAFISRRIAAGDSKNQIKDRLVAEWGPEILAAPPKKGFDLFAWLLPIVGVIGGAVALGALTWRWSRGHEPVAAAPLLDPALERRIDQELARFDES